MRYENGVQIPETPEEAAMLGQAPASPVMPPMSTPTQATPVPTPMVTEQGMLNVPEGGIDPAKPLDANAQQAFAAEYKDVTGTQLPQPHATPPAPPPADPNRLYVDQVPQQGSAPPAGGGGGMGGKMLASKAPQTYGQTPGAMEYNQKAYDFLGRQAEYGTEQAQIQANMASQQAQAYADAMARANALREESERRELERQSWARTAVARHEKAAQELAATKIDPTHFFSQGGPAGQVVSALGTALAGLGDAMLMAAGHQGGGGFMRGIHQMVDTDIAVQRANYGIKQDALRAQQGVFAERMGMFQNERVAEASAKASVYEWMAGEAKIAEARAWESSSKLNIRKVYDELSFKAEEFRLKIQIESEKAYDSAIMRQMQAYWAEVARQRKRAEEQADYEHKKIVDWATSPEGRGGFRPGEVGLTHMPKGTPNAGGLAILARDENGKQYYKPLGGAPGPGGGMGGMDPFSKKGQAIAAQTVPIEWNGKTTHLIARSEDSAKKLAATTQHTADYRNNVKKMLAILEDPTLGPFERRELYNQAFANANGAYKQMYALGAYDNGVKDLVSGVFPTYAKAFVFGDTAKSLLKAELQNTESIVHNAIDTHTLDGTKALPPLQHADAWAAKAASLGGAPKEEEKQESSFGPGAGAAAGAAIAGPLGVVPGAAAGYLFGK